MNSLISSSGGAAILCSLMGFSVFGSLVLGLAIGLKLYLNQKKEKENHVSDN